MYSIIEIMKITYLLIYYLKPIFLAKSLALVYQLI